MKSSLWFVGQQCAGKTRLAKAFADAGARVLHVGERLRQTVSAETFAAQPNPYAPWLTEDTVLEMLSVESHDFARGFKDTVIIDSAPRSEEQFKLMLGYPAPTIVVVRAPFGEREKRALARYGPNSPGMALFYAREPHEQEWITRLSGLADEKDINAILIGDE